MTTPADDNPPTLESIAKDQQHLIDAVMALSQGVQALADGQNHFNAFSAMQRDFNATVETFLADANGRFDRISAGVAGTNDKLDGLKSDISLIKADLAGTNDKLDGLKVDIGLVKGGHARNEMRHKASIIADDLGYQLIEELPQGALVALARVAFANGIAANEVESFRNADMVMMVQDASNQPGYVAVEVSYTVDGNDVRRAMRNANYLQQYTGIKSRAVVAGVDILPEAKQQADAGNVYWSEILRREIQPV